MKIKAASTYGLLPAEQSPRGDCESGNIGDCIQENFSQHGDGTSTFFSNSFIYNNERTSFNGAKFKIKMDSKKKITNRYPGEIYKVICRCVERSSITGASVGIQCVLVVLRIGMEENYEHMRVGSRH